MVKYKNEISTEVREHMRGGDGSARVTGFVSPAELNEKGRLFGKVALDPGCSIGYHIHENDCEIFYILKGTAVYSDNGKDVTVSAGDVTVCPAGTGHGIRNESNEPVEAIALIVNA